MIKKNKILIIYVIVILICLILIMFVLPDSFFKMQYEGITLPSSTSNEEEKEEVSLAEQKEHLLYNKYNYEYLLLDSMGSKTYTYECTGVRNETIESGTCTKPELASYTEETKEKVFSNINIKYLDPSFIFELIKAKEAEELSYNGLTEYIYQSEIEDLKTEITLVSEDDEISQIRLSNAYMTYILKYSNVNY